VEWDWLSPLVRRPLTSIFYQPWMIDDACGALGGIRIDRKNWSNRRKPVPVPFCPPQIPRTGGAAVGSRRLTAWAMAPPPTSLVLSTSPATTTYADVGAYVTSFCLYFYINIFTEDEFISSGAPLLSICPDGSFITFRPTSVCVQGPQHFSLALRHGAVKPLKLKAIIACFTWLLLASD
jgi:hypothetical protein